MQSYMIKASSQEDAETAVAAIAEAIGNRRHDATPPVVKQDELSPPVTKDGDDGGVLIIKDGEYSAPYWRWEVVIHDNEPPPAWPGGLAVESIAQSSFAFAEPREHASQTSQLFPDVITDRQFAHGLAKAGLISMAEAKAWVGPGTLPAAIAGFIASMPEAMRDDVEIVLIGATSFSRKHPLTETFGQSVGMTPQQLDQFWMMCASL